MTSQAQADIPTATLFDADFTAAEGFTDGNIFGQPGFTESQAGYIIDTSGTGTLSQSSGGFQRAQFGPSQSGQNVAVGDVILVETEDFSVTAGNNNARIVLGLSGGGAAGAAALAAGSQLSVNGAGDVFVENSAFGVDTTGRVDTTFNVGDEFDYGVSFTAEGAGDIAAVTYTIDHLINGVSVLNETGISLVTPDATAATFLTGFIQDQGGRAIAPRWAIWETE